MPEHNLGKILIQIYIYIYIYINYIGTMFCYCVALETTAMASFTITLGKL